MQLFLDTACLEDIRCFRDRIDGVTTNPSLLSRINKPPLEVLEEIAALVEGPISAEVTQSQWADMVQEAVCLSKISRDIVIKVPVTEEGLKACAVLSDKGISVNATLCFSVNQALLAARAGATYVSPFVGRLEDNGENGIGLLEEIRHLYDTFDYDTFILASSLRTPEHVAAAALAGSDCATLPPAVLKAMYDHPLTEKGLSIFEKDWQKTQGF